MSVPDREIEDTDGDHCVECGEWMKSSAFHLCVRCRCDLADMYADEKISERLTNRRMQ
jgi:hypothetical protein